MAYDEKSFYEKHRNIIHISSFICLSIITGVILIPAYVSYNDNINTKQVSTLESKMQPDLSKYDNQSFWLKYPDLIKMKDFGCNREPTNSELQSLTRKMIPLWTNDIPYDRLHVVCDWFFEPDGNKLVKDYDYIIVNDKISYDINCPLDCQNLYRHEFQQSLDIYKKIGFIGF